MREIRKIVVLAIAVSLLVSALPAYAQVYEDDPPASGDGITPELVPGNPTCQDLGYELGFKPQPEGGYGTFQFPDSPGDTVTITPQCKDEQGEEIECGDVDTYQYFKWASYLAIDAVLVKASNAADAYVFDEEGLEDFDDTWVHGPMKDGPLSEPHDVSHIDFCYDLPTAITLASFTAQAGSGSVALVWETGTEIDNAGFNLYRAPSADGPWSKINGALIAAQGDAVSGGSYSFVDTPGYGSFLYKLEDVDLNGVSELHGPVTAKLAAPFRRPQHRPTLPW